MSQHEYPPVTVIIPNFNGASLLRRNLPEVQAAVAGYPGHCHVIVVDDGSSDDSKAVLAEFSAVELIVHPVNRGFAEAIHSGVQAASTEYLVLLNSDVAPQQDFLAPLMTSLADSGVFAVSPLVLEESGQVSPVSWRGYSLRGGRFKPLRFLFDDPEQTPPRESLYASGGSVALKKSLFLELGGFLPIFKPFYSEDFDLGLRAWRRGWRTVLEPASRVVHQEKGSISANVASVRIRRIRTRNWFILEWLHVPARKLILSFIPRYCRQAVGRLLKLDHVYFRGFAAALCRLPEVLKLRAEIRRLDTRSLTEVMEAINAQVKKPASVR